MSFRYFLEMLLDVVAEDGIGRGPPPTTSICSSSANHGRNPGGANLPPESDDNLSGSSVLFQVKVIGYGTKYSTQNLGRLDMISILYAAIEVAHSAIPGYRASLGFDLNTSPKFG